MTYINDKQNTPASLFIAIDDFDNVYGATIMDTSDENLRKYITRQMDKIKGYDTIPDETVVEYRFPDRSAIPPLNPGFMNEYYSRDMYHALDGRNIPHRYISLRMAAFLARNGADVFQSDAVYRRISQCPEYREFSYKNSRGLYNHPNLFNDEDRKTLASIRAEGGPALADILSARSPAVEPVVSAEKRSVSKIGNHPVRRNKPPISAKRPGIPKRTKGRSM